MLPWLVADLTREWQELVIASDATPTFGFGVSIARAHPGVVRELARKAARPGMFVRLSRDDGYIDNEAEKPRKGSAYALPLSKAAF